jgi:hypothetical protein
VNNSIDFGGFRLYLFRVEPELACRTYSESHAGRIFKSSKRLPGYFFVLLVNVDPLHSCLALASLALNREPGLAPFDAELCITQRAKKRLDKAPWRTP